MKHFNFLAVFQLCCIVATGHAAMHNNQLSPAVKKLTDSIASCNVLHSSSVGLMGARTEQYNRYERLEKAATTEELGTLTNSDNAVVRCYAFRALVTREKADVFTILVKHLYDTAIVQAFEGCIVNSKKTGDYFLKTAMLPNANKHSSAISKRQKEIIDSILVFDNRISLETKSETIKHLTPEKKYYNRLRELFVSGQTQYAIIPISKYRKQSDTTLVLSLLRDNSHLARYYGLWAVRNFPDKAFFPMVSDIHNDATEARGKVDPMTMRMLYQAIVQYRDVASRKLIEKTLASVKGNARNTHIENIWIALKKYRYNTYKGILAQLNISDEEKQSLSYDLRIEG